MREQQVFPASVLNQSASQLFKEKHRISGIIYLTALFSFVGVLIAINYIYVDVNVRASGIIKPKEDHSVVLSTTSGFIETRTMALNAEVSKGDTIAIIRSELITAKLPALQSRQKELNALISDLKQLTTQNLEEVKIISPIYRQDLLYYLAQLADAKAKQKQALNAYERSRQLYAANVIPLSEFEPIEFQYTQAQNALQTLMDYQRRQWHSDLSGYRAELRDVETQIEQIKIQNAETVIIAPVSGTIQRAQTLFDGTYISAGQQLVEISPHGLLVAECYVQPKDVGYLKVGTSGRVQVSSFNYTEWGILQAEVEEIFDDVTVSSDGTQSFYKVYCTLSKDYLSLKNGYKGYLKKGMVISINFLVTRRTVFQLLYDKINDWLNPNINKEYE